LKGISPPSTPNFTSGRSQHFSFHDSFENIRKHAAGSEVVTVFKNVPVGDNFNNVE
jgi:hypothetical protein